MKLIAVFALLFIVTFTHAYPSEAADDESDIKDFNERHMHDTSILFFVNQESQEQSGFWASIFNLFGSSSESDESFLDEIADNNPLIKIDIGKEALGHSAEDYSVETVPMIIAFHHGEEILRERPTAETADKIDDIVRDNETKNLKEVDHASTVHPKRDPSETDIWDNKTDTDEHHHPKPLIVTPDFGHLLSNDPAESPLITATPIKSLDLESGANAVKATVAKQANDMLVDFKDKNLPRAEDASVYSSTPGQSRRQPTDGRKDIASNMASAGVNAAIRATKPTQASAPRVNPSAASRAAESSARQSASRPSAGQTRPTASSQTRASASVRPSAAPSGPRASVSASRNTHASAGPSGSVHSRLSNDAVYNMQSNYRR
jgi:hypothetical protein